MTVKPQSYGYWSTSGHFAEPLGEVADLVLAAVDGYESVRPGIGTQGSTSDTEKGPGVVLDIADYMPASGRKPEAFVSSAEWDGFVTEITPTSILATLKPRPAAEGNAEDWVEIPLDFLNEADRLNVQVGSIFRMASGRMQNKRQVMHGTKIYFRRRTKERNLNQMAAHLAELFS